MAGARIEIHWEYSEALSVINAMAAAGRDLEPAWREIGEYLDLAHRLRWDSQVAPDGTPWEPLDPKTIESKRRRGLPDDILVEHGYLRDLLRYETTAAELLFGSDRVYGATHQFGRPDAGIPARPWLGTSEEDDDEILVILQRHLEAV